MRPLPNCLARACSIALLIGAAAGCSSSDGVASGETDPARSVPSVVAEASTTAGTDAPATSPSPDEVPATSPSSEQAPMTSATGPTADTPGDPCALLTPAVAAQVLGVPVGEPITQPGEGNSTCAYRPADPGAQSLVVLTLYGVAGSEAVLDAAAAQFPGAEPVDGLGDAARVSVQSQTIGVLSGSTVFAIGLYPQQADGQLVPVSKDQLVAVAAAVLDGQ